MGTHAKCEAANFIDTETIVALNAHVYSSESRAEVETRTRQIILKFLDIASAPHQPAMKATCSCIYHCK